MTEYRKIEISEETVLRGLPDNCGRVVDTASNVAGLISSVIGSSNSLRDDHLALRQNIQELEADQDRVSQASDEARLLSEKAIARLGEGTELISGSLERINELIELVGALTDHVTGFAAAMDQVRRSTLDIEKIAETTNMLALNASIEAQRAGDAGANFSVVATEVKTLAANTRKATEEIGKTMDALAAEAGTVITQIEDGASESRLAQESVSRIEQTLGSVVQLVEEVDKQNDQIARSTCTISDHVLRVKDVLESFDAASDANDRQLSRSSERLTGLEDIANDLFNQLVHSGVAAIDERMAKAAIEGHAEAMRVTEQALAAGVISESQIFDENYQEIAGSNPKRYRNRLMDWAHENWRPILDATTDKDDAIIFALLNDMNGYLPTHITAQSQAPTGDLKHDELYCFNGRMIEVDRRKWESMPLETYSMYTYRQPRADGKFWLMRCASIPFVINGRRWGNFVVGYRLRSDRK